MRHAWQPKIVLSALVVLGSLFALASASGQPRPRTPWEARRRSGIRPNTLLNDRVLSEDWPAEPRAPATVDHDTFAQALRELCWSMNHDRSGRYTDWILRSANDFHVDPFLLAALMYRESRCDPEAVNLERSALGLTQIPWDMYRGLVEDHVLSYRVITGTSQEDRSFRVDRFPFGPIRVQQAEANLYFAAALLSMWEGQHETVDHAFDQVPHRHFVSHFIWGDRVRSDVEEERILADRRRLLEHYGATATTRPITWRGIELGCPLFGCPRVVLSWLGAERDGGQREHRGIDVDTLPEEPVRALGDGFVTFAGVDLPGQRAHEQVRTPAGYDAYPRSSLGAGGRYVCIRHGQSENSFASCSMHLERVLVTHGMRVHRGDVIGSVGRTGMQSSAAHLHLEIRTSRVEDPSVILQGLLLGRLPPARDRH